MLEDKRSFNEIRQHIVDNNVGDYAELYKLLYEEVESYAKGNVPSAILEVADAQYKDAHVVDKEINFMALIINLLKIGKKHE